jgi:hypothetical protein
MLVVLFTQVYDFETLTLLTSANRKYRIPSLPSTHIILKPSPLPPWLDAGRVLYV